MRTVILSAPRIRRFRIEHKARESDPWWVALAGAGAGTDYSAAFPAVTARYVRLNILDAADSPTLYEFQVSAP